MYTLCFVIVFQIVVVNLLVQERIVIILELVAGYNVVVAMSGTTVCVKEQPTVMQGKKIVFVCKNCNN